MLKKIKDLYKIVEEIEKKDNFNEPQDPDVLFKKKTFSLDEYTDWFDSLKEVLKLTDSTNSKKFVSQLFAG